MFRTTNFRKGSSLFVKLIILFGALYYLISKVEEASLLVDFSLLLNEAIFSYLLIAGVLVLLNWGLEAYKWKVLMSKLKDLSFGVAYKSVLSGLVVGILTPNRIGEFAGKLLYIGSIDKTKATIISFVGSGIQLLVTILFGFLSLAIMVSTMPEIWFYNNLMLEIDWGNVLIIAFIIVFVLGAFALKGGKLKSYFLDKISSLSLSVLMRAFLLSITRYGVFAFQFYLVLLAFNVQLPIMSALCLIALTFFVTTIIPTSALTSVVVRSGVAVFIFSHYTDATNSVIMSSMVLWMMNIGLPAIVGGVFITQKKIV